MKQDKLAEIKEQAFIEGHRAAMLSLMILAARALDGEDRTVADCTPS